MNPAHPMPEDRVKKVHGIWSVLVKDLDEFERTICRAGAHDGHFDPELNGGKGAGTVRFRNGTDAHHAAELLA